MMSAPLKRIVVVGVGLIGGSFALACKKAGVARDIVGVGRRPENLQQAQALGVIDHVLPLQQAMSGADLVLLAVPVAQTETLLQEMLPYLSEAAIVTDAGSTKQEVIVVARRVLGVKFGQFVPGHPIAGSEKSGVVAASATLFQKKRVVLCPESDTASAACDVVQHLWQACGARVTHMSAVQHDEVFASTSHLPHLLAFAYMNLLLASEDYDLKAAMAGSGFRDFTRIAGGNPEMWADIVCANKRAISADLQQYQLRLQQLQQSLAHNDRDAVLKLFEAASTARQRWHQ